MIGIDSKSYECIKEIINTQLGFEHLMHQPFIENLFATEETEIDDIPKT
jgi:hypothetical protein